VGSLDHTNSVAATSPCVKCITLTSAVSETQNAIRSRCLNGICHRSVSDRLDFCVVQSRAGSVRPKARKEG
jgi:hypothetical protein